MENAFLSRYERLNEGQKILHNYLLTNKYFNEENRFLIAENSELLEEGNTTNNIAFECDDKIFITKKRICAMFETPDWVYQNMYSRNENIRNKAIGYYRDFCLWEYPLTEKQFDEFVNSSLDEQLIQFQSEEVNDYYEPEDWEE